jgi:hypothetical protein
MKKKTILVIVGTAVIVLASTLFFVSPDFADNFKQKATQTKEVEAYPCMNDDEVYLIDNRPNRYFYPLEMMVTTSYETYVNETGESADRFVAILTLGIMDEDVESIISKPLRVGEQMEYQNYRITVLDIGLGEVDPNPNEQWSPTDYACIRVESLNITPTPAEMSSQQSEQPERQKSVRYPCSESNEVFLLSNRPSTNAFSPLVMVASNFFYEKNIDTIEKTADRLAFFLEVWIYRGEPGSSQQKRMWIGETMDYKGYRITVVDLAEDEEFETDGGGFTISGDYACVRVENLNTTPAPAE